MTIETKESKSTFSTTKNSKLIISAQKPYLREAQIALSQFKENLNVAAVLTRMQNPWVDNISLRDDLINLLIQAQEDQNSSLTQSVFKVLLVTTNSTKDAALNRIFSILSHNDLLNRRNVEFINQNFSLRLYRTLLLTEKTHLLFQNNLDRLFGTIDKIPDIFRFLHIFNKENLLNQKNFTRTLVILRQTEDLGSSIAALAKSEFTQNSLDILLDAAQQKSLTARFPGVFTNYPHNTTVSSCFYDLITLADDAELLNNKAAKLIANNLEHLEALYNSIISLQVTPSEKLDTLTFNFLIENAKFCIPLSKCINLLTISGLWDEVNSKKLSKKAAYAEYLKNIFMTLLQTETLDQDNFETVIHKSKDDFTQLDAAFTKLEIRGLTNAARVEHLVKNSLYAEHIADAMICLNDLGLLTNPSYSAFITDPKIAKSLSRCMGFLENASLLTNSNKKLLIENPEKLEHLETLLFHLYDFDLVNQNNFNSAFLQKNLKIINDIFDLLGKNNLLTQENLDAVFRFSDTFDKPLYSALQRFASAAILSQNTLRMIFSHLKQFKLFPRLIITRPGFFSGQNNSQRTAPPAAAEERRQPYHATRPVQ